jgi:hypothetical protein
MRKVPCLKVLIIKEHQSINKDKGNTAKFCNSKRYINIKDIFDPKIEFNYDSDDNSDRENIKCDKVSILLHNG